MKSRERAAGRKKMACIPMNSNFEKAPEGYRTVISDE